MRASRPGATRTSSAFARTRRSSAGGIFVYLRERSENRVWSAGYQPTKAEPDFYDVAFAIDHVAISRRDGDIETCMEIAVSPEHPAEVRRVTLTNHGSEPREIDVTTYAEAVLAPRAADVAHRAFASMFVETEWLPERVHAPRAAKAAIEHGAAALGRSGPLGGARSVVVARHARDLARDVHRARADDARARLRSIARSSRRAAWSSIRCSRCVARCASSRAATRASR